MEGNVWRSPSAGAVLSGGGAAASGAGAATAAAGTIGTNRPQGGNEPVRWTYGFFCTNERLGEDWCGV